MTTQAKSTNPTQITTGPSDRELTIERTFNAPRELVFKAWTEPELLKKWFGPKTFPLTICNVDLRPGGVWHYCMTGPNGEQAWGKAIYDEVVAPERLVYTDGFSDAEGNINQDMPVSRATVTFTAQGNTTKVVSSVVYPTAADVRKVLDMGMAEGVADTYDNLDQLLA